MEKRSLLKGIFAVFIIIFMVISYFPAVNPGFNVNGAQATKQTGQEYATGTSVPGLNTGNLLITHAVDPCKIYQKEPAPMGIADYGVGLGGSPYSYNTTSFLGTINLSALKVSNSTNCQVMTFQLNVNLEFYSGSINYVYWIQDVAYLNTSDNCVVFIDNVWNMSASGANMYNSSISGNGTVCQYKYQSYYVYCAGNTMPGNDEKLKYPATIDLMVNSTIGTQLISGTKSPKVSFLYNDGSGWVTFDSITFPFLKGSFKDCNFVVNGKTYEPSNLFYNAELIMGGPGGGQSTTAIGSSASLNLQFWNGHNFQEIENAYNFGSDTAETISNIVSGSITTNGSVMPRENITAGSGSLEQVYTTGTISVLDIKSPIKNGELLVNGTGYHFTGGFVNLTLSPGAYTFKLYDGSLLYKEFNYTLPQGKTIYISTNESIVKFTESGLPKGIQWSVKVNGRINYSITNALCLFVVNGTYNYTVHSYFSSYIPENISGNFKVKGQELFLNVTFIPLNFTVTFQEKGIGKNQTWTVTICGITKTSSGQNITFEIINGTHSYQVTNSGGLYSPESQGTVFVNRTAQVVNITFEKNPGLLSKVNIVVFSMLAVIILLLAYAFRKRKKA